MLGVLLLSNLFYPSEILKADAKLYADIIIFNGNIITVDKSFSTAQAIAIKGNRILEVGSDQDILELAGPATRKIDLKGKTVLPGLIDAHLHPVGAAESELFEEIPDVHSIKDLLDWIESETEKKELGEWIVHPRLFFTRLRELRQPTLEELDRVAPENPVFLNGAYAGMINTKAMLVSGLDEQSQNPGIVKDETTGKPTGFIRATAFSLLKNLPTYPISYDQRLDAIEKMLRRYNRVGITSLTDGAQNPSGIKIYQDLRNQDRLPVRISMNIMAPRTETKQDLSKILQKWGFYTQFGDEWIRIGALKIILDGGILTGTAFMREPWGLKAKEIYGIKDPEYRGILNYDRPELENIVTVANAHGWKMTAHCTGGGAVDMLLDAYEKAHKESSISEKRFSIIHGNFYTAEAITRCARLGVIADCQPAWFYKDADAMKYILGPERVNRFLPFRQMLSEGMILNGGSDHMIKYDPNTSTNPYNPFLGMWIALTRKTERGSIIVPEQTISREQVLRMYTINNAYGTFEEDIKGSLEPGKLADLIVVSDDFMSCPVMEIKDMKVEMALVGGQIVFTASE
jgi:predicted amidohydrolase YtcJ